LYPALDWAGRELKTVLEILSEVLNHLDKAIAADKDRDALGSDLSFHQVQAILPELFCLRNVSDGLGAVVNAVQIGIENQNGKSLETEQLRAMRRCFYELRETPFLTFDRALEVIEAVESTGINTGLPALESIADAHDEG
jgi:hypothetical protein